MLRLSKTKIDAFDKCPRYGYLNYYYNGTGIDVDGVRGAELALGVAIHKGVEVLFKGLSIEAAILAAFNEFDLERAGAPETPLTMEQRLVIEASLRLWASVRLPQLLEEYEHVYGEREMTVNLSDVVSLYARPDAILRSKADGRWVNWSLKTERSHGAIKHPSALIDTGGLTESACIAIELGNGDLKQVMGSLMEYIIVGKPDDEEPIIWNHLIRGWRRPADMGGYDYAWRYKFPNPDFDPYGPKSAKTNPEYMSLQKRDGWERFNATSYPDGIAGWVRDLIAHKFVPYHMDPVQEVIYAPLPYVRTESAVASFVEQTISEYSSLEAKVERVASGEATLDAAFPKRRQNCLRMGEKWRCKMWSICWEGLTNPIGNGFKVKERRDAVANEIDLAPSNDVEVE
jgi:hypothetical protein